MVFGMLALLVDVEHCPALEQLILHLHAVAELDFPVYVGLFQGLEHGL